MISTLFSPSEGKRGGGEGPALQDDALLFGLPSRRPILEAYDALVNGPDRGAALALFGLKKPEDAAPYFLDLFTAPTLPALERYDGVAYDYLDYASLDAAAKAYLQTNLIIFSNLFGPLRGGDRIPNYKVKQGNAVEGIAPERYYSDAFNDALNALTAENEILDLRAGYYDKFFTPAHPVTTMKFVKDGKVVSHWAKAYRGIVLRHLARHRFPSLRELLASDIPGLRIAEIQEKRRKTEVVYDIIQA